MNPTLIVTAVTGVLSLIAQFLPLVGGSNTAAIGGILKTLTDLLPLITDQIGATYTGVRISSIRSANIQPRLLIS